MFSVEQNTKVINKCQLLTEYIEIEIQEFVKGLLETILLEEQKEYIHRDKYEHFGKEGMFTVYRNGYRKRYYLSSFTKMIQLKVPRCRGGNFQPVLFRKGILTNEIIDEIIIHLWSDGNSYRDLREFVKKIYGTRISLSLINRIIHAVEKYVEQYHNKKIEYKYDAIYIDGLYTTIKEYPKRSNDEDVKKKNKNAIILAVLGQRREGKKVIREIIDYRICKSENTEDYTELLRGLKQRGLYSERINLVVHDGEQSILTALENVYGKNIVKDQDCLIHRKRNILKQVKNKTNKEELGNDVWQVYSSETREDFLKKHKEIYTKWYIEEPEAMEIFSLINENQLTKFEFDIEMHKDIHSNNPIERMFREFRRRILPMGIFETEKSADVLIFLIVENLNQRRGSKPTNGDLKFTH